MYVSFHKYWYPFVPITIFNASLIDNRNIRLPSRDMFFLFLLHRRVMVALIVFDPTYLFIFLVSVFSVDKDIPSFIARVR